METCGICDEPLTGPTKKFGDYVWDEDLGEVYEEFVIHADCM